MTNQILTEREVISCLGNSHTVHNAHLQYEAIFPKGDRKDYCVGELSWTKGNHCGSDFWLVHKSKTGYVSKDCFCAEGNYCIDSIEFVGDEVVVHYSSHGWFSEAYSGVFRQRMLD